MPTKDSKLGTFLINLAEDPQLHADFVADPKATMKAFRLSDAQIDVVLSKDSKGMSAALAQTFKGGRFGAAGDSNTTVVVVVVVVV
jgi:Aromatic-ring-opening dioxygenase LigAB, LigA subunit